MELWEKLKVLRAESKLTLEQVAQRMPSKVTRTAVGFWESDNPANRTEPRKANREALAKLYSVTVSDLMSQSPVITSAVNKQSPRQSESSAKIFDNVLATTILPVVHLNDAGRGTNRDMMLERTGKIHALATVSADAFAIKVEGNGMYQAGKEPSYPHGSIIICDPALRDDVKIGDDVIARLISDDTRVFKSYDSLDGTPVLAALNSSHPVITDDFEVLAVVVQMVVIRR